MQRTFHRMTALTALVLAAQPGQAATWSSPTTSSGACLYGTDAVVSGNTCQSGTMTASAWSSNNNNTNNTTAAFQTAGLTVWGGGFGVKANGTDINSPQHSIDNNGPEDAVLLAFAGGKVSLSSLTTGWSQTDQDITVLAFTGGSNAPDLTKSTITRGSSSSTFSSNMLGAFNAGTGTGGWSVVGNYAYSAVGGTGNTTINLMNSGANAIASSYWLVMAYNSAFGSTVTSGAGTLGNGNDYFKLQSASGTAVPEPGGLALVALALSGLVVSRRRIADKK